MFYLSIGYNANPTNHGKLINQTDQSWIIGSTKPTNHGSLVQPIQPIIMEQRLTKLTNHGTAINQTNQSWNSD